MSAADLLLHLRAAGFDLAADDGKLLVTPGSMLTDDMCASIRSLKPELVVLLTDAESRPPVTTTTLSSVSTCTDCQHLLRRGTCAEPEGAGLIPAGARFGLAWPPAGHAATCASYSSKTTAPTLERPHSLTKAQGGTAHAESRDDAAMARFQTRAEAIQRRGFGHQDAADLSGQLHLRDVQADHRHLCIECRHYSPGRCNNHRRAGISAPDVGRDMAVLLQRCPGFQVEG